MRFLFRALLYFLLIALTFRLLRNLRGPRRRDEASPVPNPPRVRRSQPIEDASFTEVKDH